MGVPVSTARLLAPATFLYDFLMQQYGMLSTPNMKDVHDANPAAFSPQPFFIGAFFAPQQLLQLAWLRELWRKDSEVEGNTLQYVGYYALGNFLIGTWLPFWNSSNLKSANIFVTINSFSQLYWLFFKRDPAATTYQGKLTNAVGITFAGIGVLDFLHNTAVAYYPMTAPNVLVQAATLIGFPVLAFFSPVLFGACLVYDQIGLGVGQYQLAQKAMIPGGTGGGGGQDWAHMLFAGAAATAAVVGLRYYRDKKLF